MSRRQRAVTSTRNCRRRPQEYPNRRGEVEQHLGHYYGNEMTARAYLGQLRNMPPGILPSQRMLAPLVMYPNWTTHVPRHRNPNQWMLPDFLSNTVRPVPPYRNPNQGMSRDLPFNVVRPMPRYRIPNQRMPRGRNSYQRRPMPRYRNTNHGLPRLRYANPMMLTQQQMLFMLMDRNRMADMTSPRSQNRGRLNRHSEVALPVAANTPPISLPPNEDFVKLDRERVLDIIQKDNLNASPQEICEAVLKWVEEDDSRREHLRELLLEVRLIFLPLAILEGLENNPLVKETDSCSEYVFWALYYRRKFPPQRAYVLKHNKFEDDLPEMTSEILKGRFCKQRISYGPAKRIYVFGSFTNSTSDIAASTVTSVEFFDLQNHRWTEVEDMRCARQGFAAAAFNDNIWIVGGVCDGQGIVSTVDIYNPASNAWTTGPPTMEKRSSLGLVAYNGSLYVIGGRTETRDSNKSTEVIGHDSQSWSEGVPMNVFRADMGAAALRSRIYVVGGVQPNAENSMEFFCSKINQWTLLSKKRLFNRDCRGIAVDDELLYIIGGDREKNCNIYNPAANHKHCWQSIPKVNRRCINRFSAVAAVDGFIYVIGGLIANRRMDTVGQYDLANCKWKLTSHCKSARAGAKAVVVNAP